MIDNKYFAMNIYYPNRQKNTGNMAEQIIME